MLIPQKAARPESPSPGPPDISLQSPWTRSESPAPAALRFVGMHSIKSVKHAIFAINSENSGV